MKYSAHYNNRPTIFAQKEGSKSVAVESFRTKKAFWAKLETLQAVEVTLSVGDLKRVLTKVQKMGFEATVVWAGDEPQHKAKLALEKVI